jgi:chloramphenicol O-acetyltransferase type A
MPRFVDVEQWPRREAYEFFRGYAHPYFNVCVPLEVGRLVELSRSLDCPFTLAFLYLAGRVANEYEPFRYRLQDGRLIVHDRIHVGTTLLLEQERLGFAHYEYHDDFAAFRERAAQVRQGVEAGLEAMNAWEGRTDLLHTSSMPWFAFTGITHAHPGPGDSVPKLTFGRYQRGADGGVRMPLAVEVHHAVMDGVHVARYLERLQGYLSDPRPVLAPGAPADAED